MNTAASPRIIPKIMAPTEPITVKKPLTAQAQGTSCGARVLTRRNPVGNGTPRAKPNGATSATLTPARNGIDRVSPRVRAA
jgi:hypothetical protein